MDTQTEDALMQRLRDGDGEAFGQLFAESAEALSRRLREKIDVGLQRRLSTADLMQEVRLAAWRDHKSFEPRGTGSFRRWLLGIADHVLSHARARHRAAKRNRQLEVSRLDRAATGEFLGNQTSPSQAAMRGELTERVREAIASLREIDRQVVELVHREHLSLRQIAERIGKNYEATKKIHARALLRLAGILGSEEEVDDD